jgi:hypothetical protein
MRLSPLDPWAFAAFDATDQQGVHLCVPNIRFSMDAENRRGKFAT